MLKTPNICIAIAALAMACFGNGPEDNAVRQSKNGVEFSSQESNCLFPEMPEAMRARRAKRDTRELITLDAHRALTESERTYVLSLCDYLIDKRYDWTSRDTAAQSLGGCGHSIAIPALLAVIRDEEDNINVRVRAVYALGRINDKRVVMYLVEDGLGSGERPIIHAAWEALSYFVSDVPDKLKDVSYVGGFRPPPGTITREKDPPPIDPQELENYLDIWREWWRKNHDEVTVSRPLGRG